MSELEKKNVIVKLTGFHETSGDEEICTSSEGKMVFREPYYYVSYKEKLDEESEELTDTLLKIKEDEVIVTRKGNAKSTLTFKKGSTHKSDYVTEMGVFEIEIITDDLYCEISEKMIKTEVSYRIGLNGTRPTESRMNMEIKII